MKKHRKYLLLYLFLFLVTALARVQAADLPGKVLPTNVPTQHLIVISIDALNALDADYLKTLSNFQFLFTEGSYAAQVVGVYPSLTYPSHTSIITGTYPATHGIANNELLSPGLTEAATPWYWYTRDIKVPTLYQVAKKAHLKVGAIFWPVTAGAKIDYNCPEIWPVRKGQNQIIMSLTNGSPLFLLDLERRFGKLRNGKAQPNLDNFAAASAAYMIRSKKPDLSLIHFTELDESRHKYGTFSSEARAALASMNERFGQIVQATKDAGIFATTTFIVLGDHGFLDYDYNLAPNAVLAKEGLITVDAQGQVKDWQAYVQTACGSAQVFLKDKNNATLREKVLGILQSLQRDENNGIEAVYTKDEAAKKGLTGEFEFVIEARKGYNILSRWTGDYKTAVDKSIPGQNEVATHGYDPNKPGYRTMFIAYGPGVKSGVHLDSINMIDEAPTMAALLGLSLPTAEGRVLTEILK